MVKQNKATVTAEIESYMGFMGKNTQEDVRHSLERRRQRSCGLAGGPNEGA
jgi:hypothetical protein